MQRYTLVLFVIATAWMLGDHPVAAQQTPADPCPLKLRRGVPEVARAREAKKQRLRENGVPERYLHLLDKYECVECINTAPDTVHVTVVWTDEFAPRLSTGAIDKVTSVRMLPQVERQLRDDLSSGRVESFHVRISEKRCRCCPDPEDQQPEDYDDWDDDIGANMDQADSFDDPSDLPPLPDDLQRAPAGWVQPPPIEQYQKPRRRFMQVTCPACQGLADQWNQAAGGLDYLWDRKVSLQEQINVVQNAIGNRNNEINELEYQQRFDTSRNYDRMKQIEQLEQYNASHESDIERDERELENVEQLMKEQQARMDALMQKVLECEKACKKTTTQVAVADQPPAVATPDPTLREVGSTAPNAPVATAPAGPPTSRSARVILDNQSEPDPPVTGGTPTGGTPRVYDRELFPWFVPNKVEIVTVDRPTATTPTGQPVSPNDHVVVVNEFTPEVPAATVGDAERNRASLRDAVATTLFDGAALTCSQPDCAEEFKTELTGCLSDGGCTPATDVDLDCRIPGTRGCTTGTRNSIFEYNLDNTTAWSTAAGADLEPRIQIKIGDVFVDAVIQPLQRADIRSWFNPLGLIAKRLVDNVERWRGSVGPRPLIDPRDLRTLERYGGGQSAGLPKGVHLLLSDRGGSTGKTLGMQILNLTGQPVKLSSMPLVVEPLKQQAQARVQQSFARLAKAAPVNLDLAAYCVEFLKLPPGPNTLYRLAPPEVQQRFAPMAKVLRSAYRVKNAGLLHPDSNPAAYTDSIKQWAVWTVEQKFNESRYTDAFIGHTRKNVEGSGQKWSKQAEDVLRKVSPNRWRDIAQILRGAGVPVPQ